MLINTSWLLDYLEPHCSHAEILGASTPAGLEVEESHDLSEELRQVVIGFVRDVRPIAEAPGMHHCRIEVAKNNVIDVVCASEHEVQVGWGVPVAVAGTELPNGTEIRAGNYHGVPSSGMISLDGELGLVARKSGLQVFEDESLLGKPLTDVTDISEFLVDLAILPNRPDCLGMVGIAREVAAVLGLKLKYPVTPDRHLKTAMRSTVPVHIEDPALCPRYLCQAIRGVKVGPSPHWLKSRLLLSGKRPINNIVDITNFVLLEWGQPLHAFDLSTIRGSEIHVRLMRTGETLELLDGTVVKADSQPLVIADAERPVALAGIMGGSATQTTAATTDILLEAACFNPVNIRATSKRLGVRSDSSYRFERGTDPNRMLIGAATRACELILELAGGQLDGVCTEQYPEPRKPRTFQLSADHFTRYLGMPVDAETIRTNLEKLEMTCSDDLQVEAPTWRMDANDRVALIEDVARLVGYDAIPLQPTSSGSTTGGTSPLDRWRREVADALTANGFLECRTPPLREEDEDGRFTATSEPIRLRNPMRADMIELRRSLLPSLVEVVERNARRGAESFRFYEIDRTFRLENGEPSETWCVGLTMAGPLQNRSWQRAGDLVAFHHLKGVMENLLEAAGLADAEFVPVTRPGFVAGRTATIHHDGRELGVLGEVDPALLAKSKLRISIFAGELNLQSVMAHFEEIRRFSGLPRTQSVTRDLALILPVEVDYGVIEQTVREAFAAAKSVETRLERFTCIDHYRGKPIPADRKSLTVRLVFRDAGGTLTSEDSNTLTQAVIEALVSSHSAELRG